MYCTKCKQMLFACTCPSRVSLPPVSLTHHKDGNVGTINPLTGVISAPTQPYHGLRATPHGGIPGTDLWIQPGGLIGRGPYTPR